MFDFVLSDPPWPYYGDPNKNAAAGKHYTLMSIPELKAMPVREVMKTPSACFMWTTAFFFPLAVEVMQAWGYHYRGIPFIWVKTRQDGGIVHGQGIPPTFTKPNAEFIIGGSSSRTGRPLKLIDHGMRQVVLAPRDRHSQKPEIFQTLIEQLFGPLNYLELFARRLRLGWHCSGIELTGIDYRTGNLL